MNDGDILRAGVSELIDKAYHLILPLKSTVDALNDMTAIALTLGLQQSSNPEIGAMANSHEMMKASIMESVVILNAYITVLEEYRDTLMQ